MVVESKLKVRTEPTVTTGAVWMVGTMDGLREGVAFGALVELVDAMGTSVVSKDGDEVGSADGSTVGSTVGSMVGSAVGSIRGTLVGYNVGTREGNCEGESVGGVVGLLGDDVVGPSVGVVLVGSLVVDSDGTVVKPEVGSIVARPDVGPMDAESG